MGRGSHGPAGALLIQRLSFNVGVELGQLIFIAVVLVAIHLVQRVYELPRQAVVASAYVIGTIAAFWSIERFDSMFM
ncbi:HupE/UreJ family protein [Mesorhizobium sp.]|uniref:HupE/UreJ family protein n=1 Tax=Mesorhizobium sp. TaxID=1871066 RepID=UPI00258102F1|nr:HupE/UreJ family protein [Mesorhizobium sp.]